MNDDQPTYIVNQSNDLSEKGVGGVVGALLLVFVLFAVGRFIDHQIYAAWTTIQPYYDSLVDQTEPVRQWLDQLFN
ncbi:hypothetical protein [Notoacmeibacter sp. MSK16QG-6]|uniref:hypothetical protein n=1 Tax=Notoacmeibacter sp. MSK16QG-6 TaxID=2957982 RepID=UPI0020A09C91|nr:hypothetical protein [Notoacmeibacter sp. MSK16QG-6]MCP1201112.1 hypothetical protein [Notoacmeibacter sp. MSK16QG-6]